jgi:hypothetical protein
VNIFRHLTLQPRLRRPMSVVGDSKKIGPVHISVQVSGDSEWSRRICALVMEAFVTACRAEGIDPEVSGSFEAADERVHHHTGPAAHGGYAEHSHEVRRDHRGVRWVDDAK